MKACTWLALWTAGLALATTGCDDGGGGGSDPADAIVVGGDMAPEPEPDMDLEPEPDMAPEPERDMAVEPDAAPDPEPDMAPDPEPEPEDPEAAVGECGERADEKSVNGWLYSDLDASDLSVYAAAFGMADAIYEGDPVRLLGADGELAPERCDDGSYLFANLDEGTYFSYAEPADGEVCSRRNCPGRFARAVVAGQAKMVTFGDSIAVVGSDDPFPGRLAALFEPIADVENVNVAIPGSTSETWLPDRAAFGRDLAPHLADADLIVVTLGGNDVLGYIGSFGGIPADIPAAIEGARDVVRQVVANFEVILAEIRAINPDADVAYILYADYTQATGDPIWGLVGAFLGRETLQDILALARDSLPPDPHLVLVDMFGAAEGLPLHELLADQVHFNEEGHTFYAEEVFTTLGGVLVGPNPLFEGSTPLGLRRSYGFRAAAEAQAE